MAAYLLDTSVGVRQVHRESPMHAVAVAGTAALVADGHTLHLTPQVLIEFWTVATRPAGVNGLGWEPALVKAEVDALLERFRMLEDTPAVFEHWLALVASRRIRGKRTHDTRLVAVMQAHGIHHVLTFNVDDFAGFEGITVVAPTGLCSP